MRPPPTPDGRVVEGRASSRDRTGRSLDPSVSGYRADRKTRVEY